MYDHTFSKLVHHQIRHQATHRVAVSLVIAYGHFNLPQGFVWVYMGERERERERGRDGERDRDVP